VESVLSLRMFKISHDSGNIVRILTLVQRQSGLQLRTAAAVGPILQQQGSVGTFTLLAAIGD